MNNRKVMVMRELGLTPVWRVRGQEIEGGSHGSAVSDQEDAARNGSIKGNERIEVAQASSAAPASDAERRTIVLKMDWPELKVAVAGCVACPLSGTRTRTVFGVGDERASWLFVGEGPGADEDRQGEPFVGQGGKLLDNMLSAIALQRGKDVYIANIVKCRPPKNRNPEAKEAASCEPYLTRQIQLLKPKLIVALGKVAVQNLLSSAASIVSLRGRLHDYHGTPLIVTYHPAYLLRNPTDKARAWEDLCFARASMATLQSAPGPS